MAAAGYLLLRFAKALGVTPEERRRHVEAMFPKARAFVRPGFDEA